VPIGLLGLRHLVAVGVEEENIYGVVRWRCRIVNGDLEPQELELRLKHRAVAPRRMFDQRMQAAERTQVAARHLATRRAWPAVAERSGPPRAPRVRSSRSSQVR